jgi:hypothetical protein
MGSGNLLGASSRFAARLYKPDEDQVAKLKFKKNKEVEAEMINDVKIEAALKVKKLLLLGEIKFCGVEFLSSVSALLCFLWASEQRIVLRNILLRFNGSNCYSNSILHSFLRPVCLLGCLLSDPQLMPLLRE